MKRLIATMCMMGSLWATEAQTIAGAPGASGVLARIDANQAFRTIEYTGRMEIRLGKELRVKSMKVWAMGSDKAFVEFTNPEDAGTRMLKLDKNLWIYFPKEQDTVPISGHLLKDGMMGSDMSYEDALESDELSSMYTASLTGETMADGRHAYIVELKATSPRAKYDRRVLTVDAERFVVLSEEMYARSGRLLKSMVAKEVKRIGERWYATTVVMVDKLRKDSSTTMVMESLKLDVVIDPGLFTRAALER
jgi:hypothetical protein